VVSDKKKYRLQADQTFAIYFVYLPVGHLTSTIAVPDTLAGCTAEKLVAFEAIGAVVGHLFLFGDKVASFLQTYCKERNG